MSAEPSKYRFVSRSDGFRVEATDRAPISVDLCESGFRVHGDSERQLTLFADVAEDGTPIPEEPEPPDTNLVQYRRLVDLVTDGVMSRWQPPAGRIGFWRVRKWAIKNTRRALGGRIHEQWRRLIAKASPTVWAVQKAVFAATFRESELLHSPLLYENRCRIKPGGRMLTELGGKSGRLCQPAREGKLRCPLNVRPTSEDVVTGELFGTLGAINPRWWLPDVLNQALGVERFRRQVYRGLRIELWQKQPEFPRELTHWDEGLTETDVEITWENPPTTVFIEMKYSSGLSSRTVHNDGNDGFPSDQLIRNARIGLHQCGWYSKQLLFELPPRDFVLILMTPSRGNRLVDEYRNEHRLRRAIPNGHRLEQLPALPFIGELSYAGLAEILRGNRRFLTTTERRLTGRLIEYLGFKISQHRRLGRGRNHQGRLPH